MKKLNFIAAATLLLGITTAQAQNPALYGMTYLGGINSYGSLGNIYKISPNPLSFANELNFTGGSGPAYPRYGHLIQAPDGNLYGMTFTGGYGTGYGVIFRYSPIANSTTTLVEFTGLSGPYYGSAPLGSLILGTDGNLYGLTNGGETYNVGDGNIFEYNLTTNTYTNLVTFTGVSGAYPGSAAWADLVQAPDGNLYGMTATGGANSWGNMFEYNLTTQTYTDLINFSGGGNAPYDGEYPDGNLTVGPDGNLYGMTSAGGASHYGNLFEFNLTSRTYTSLFDFTGNTGAYPGTVGANSLVLGSDGNFYGITEYGGTNNQGTIFSYNVNTSTFTNLVNLTGSSGANPGIYPIGALIQASDGNFYGTAAGDLYVTDGSAFEYNPLTSTYTNLVNFTGTSGPYNGITPCGTLMEYYYATINVTSNITCYGYDNGNAMAIVGGGVSPYTYARSNGTSTVSISNPTGAILSAGSYTLTVTDNKGRSVTATTTITQPPALFHDSIVTVANVGCHGGNGGSATIGTKGTAGPYTYQWAPNTNSTSKATGLTAGSYTVTVTSKYGCSNTLLVTITQPGALTGSVASITYPTCNGRRGDITVLASGGTLPYSYFWTGGVSTTATATNISSRTYTVTIKDKYDCSVAPIVVNLTQPAALRDTIVSSSKVNILCNGRSTGSATVGIKYGLSPFTYAWTNGQTNITATALSAGIYSVTVTDNNGCSGSVAKVTITQPGDLRDSISALSCISSLVKATVGTKGGVSPYAYAWAPGGGTKAIMSNLTPGSYTITVTDKNGCSLVLDTSLACPPIELLKDNSGPLAAQNNGTINIYPNPSTGQFTVQSSVISGQSSIEIFNILGEKVYSQFNIQNSQFTINISDQPAGIYLIRILDRSGNLVSQKKIVKT